MTAVVMLVNEFPPLPAGGAEKQAERLSGYLAAQGLQIRVLTRAGGGLPRHEWRDGFAIERVPAPGPGKLAPLLFALGAMLSLLRHRRQYQVLHAHLAFAPAVAAAVMGWLLGKKIVVKYGNSGPFGDVQVSSRSWLGRLKLAILRRFVDLHIALDSIMEDELLGAKFPRERVVRMVNGIEMGKFERRAAKPEAQAALGLAGKTVLLYVGRLAPQKALPDLFAALQSALTAWPDLHLLLLGDGEERQALEALSRQLGIAAQISFAGNVASVQPYLDAADMFVLPSLSEGISNALLEAMTAGLACVATAVGGTPEVLDQGACGIVLPPARPDLFAEAIVRLASDPQELARLGEAARARVARTYAFNVVGDQYIALYHRLTAASPQHSDTLSSKHS
jgi:glycosyltransferase involved in cell wall biosynthesis